MLVRSVRPRFRVRVPMSADRVVARIEKRLQEPDCPCRGMVAARHHVIDLRVRERDRHFWSPALGVSVAEVEDAGGGSVVHGLIGPEPGVWTLFAMLYFGLLTAFGFAAIFGLVQWWLDLQPWGLWIAGGAVLATVAMYATARIGQSRAAPQTAMLRHFLESALDLPPEERAVTDRDPYHERPAE